MTTRTSTSDCLNSVTIPRKICEALSADAIGPASTQIVDARPSLHIRRQNLKKCLPACKKNDFQHVSKKTEVCLFAFLGLKIQGFFLPRCS